MGRALFHVDNSYAWPALRATGTVCRTNQPSHTAFRGFGAPQGMMVSETAIEHLADVCGLDVQMVREKNLYRQGGLTHFGQPLEEFNVPQAWDHLMAVGDASQPATPSLPVVHV